LRILSTGDPRWAILNIPRTREVDTVTFGFAIEIGAWLFLSGYFLHKTRPWDRDGDRGFGIIIFAISFAFLWWILQNYGIIPKEILPWRTLLSIYGAILGLITLYVAYVTGETLYKIWFLILLLGTVLPQITN
jgi:hypothetical protein